MTGYHTAGWEGMQFPERKEVLQAPGLQGSEALSVFSGQLRSLFVPLLPRLSSGDSRVGP